MMRTEVEATRQQFADALAKGTGRAMILLREARDPSIFRGLIADACIRNLAFDPQCEDERSVYLARLVQASGAAAELFGELAPRLDCFDEDTDVPQLFGVLARLVGPDDSENRTMLRRAFNSYGADLQRDCAEELVRLEGLPGLIAAAGSLAPHIDEEGWRALGLVRTFEEREGDKAPAMLRDAGAQHPALQRLLEAAEAPDEPPSSPSDRAWDFDTIRSQLLRGRRPPGAWLWSLGEVQWRVLADDFATVAEEPVAQHYLRLFSLRSYPGDVRRLLHWVGSAHDGCAWAAVRAARRLKAPEVRAMALERIRAVDPAGLRLLRSNYQPGDLEEVWALLGAPSEARDLHDLGLGLLDLAENNTLPLEAGRRIMTWIYEHGPCSMCRGSAVRWLHPEGAVPEWMAAECRFDADLETAAMFAEDPSQALA